MDFWKWNGLMSFTLRTLLAYLDNAPLPAAEREPIQQALEQNPAAQELVHRIRTLLVQPRMASPAVETAGLLQANQVAEYLDGTSDFDVTKKYEQSCLKNDAALSEIAALHQILTDWIDQPTYIGDELRQRIYQFAGSWAETTAADDEVQTDRAVGRDAIQAAAQLLQVRELGMDQVTPTTSYSQAASSSVSAKKSPASTNEKVSTTVSKSLSDKDVASGAPKSKIATSAVKNSSTEEAGQGSWILALLVLVGFGVLWWTQQPHSEMAGFALNSPAGSTSKDASKDLVAQQPSSSIQLPSLPDPKEGDAMANLSAPSATLPPIHLSSGSNQPPLMLGNSSMPSPTASDSELAIPSLPAAEIPTLPTPVLESPSSNSSIATETIPDLAAPEPATNTPADTTPPTPPNNSNAIGGPETNTSNPLSTSPAPQLPHPNENAIGMPLASNTPNTDASKPKPAISELPPVDEESPSTLPSVPDSIPPSGFAANSAANPLVPAATAASTPPASIPTEPNTNTRPEEWGQQVGTVVVEAETGQGADDWILVLPGGRSQLKMRSPRGKAWNFTFAGVSRYQLQEKEGLPLLSVQRCFVLMQSTSQDESLEIQTPKGKVFITALTPEAELVFEIRPFLPLGFTAANTAPRYYLGCLGIAGRFMIEHQGREEVLYENKWFVVRPDGQSERHEKSSSPAILATIQEMKDSQMNPDVTALGELVKSSEGMDELFSIANGTHVHSQQITLDQRSLAALWAYGLGQMDPAFAVLNDPQFKSYWDVHIQAIASCLQSDPASSGQLTTAASRVGLTSAVDTRFVGLDPPTVKMSQLNELITDLEHAQVARRVLALHALQVLTKETFGYDPSASGDSNQVPIEKWKQWLADSARAKISINPTNGLVPR